MEREEIYREIQETLGCVPPFFRLLPDSLVAGEWESALAYYREQACSCPGRCEPLEESEYLAFCRLLEPC
jgi:hypothetical protein